MSQITPNSKVAIFTGTIKASNNQKNLLGENRQIRSSYAEVYHRGFPENGSRGFFGGWSNFVETISEKLLSRFG